MKANKPLLSLMFSIIILLLMATNGFCAQSVSIDTAIKNSAAYFEQQLQKNITIAVINVGSDSLRLSEYIIDELSSYFINGKNFTVVDRRNSDAAQQEDNNLLSGEVSDRTAQSIGQRIGVQNVIFGNIQPFGNDYRLDIRALSVETGVVRGVYRQDIKSDNKLTALLSGNALLASEAWKNNWLYLGFRLGGGYLPAIVNTNPSSYYSDFHAAFSITGQITDQFGIQSGLIYSLDKEVKDGELTEGLGHVSGSFYQNKLTIPILASFSIRPQNFLFGGLGGIYFSFPIGNMNLSVSDTIVNAPQQYTYTPVSPGAGIMLGTYLGYHIGPGVLLLDLRYLQDLKGTEYEASAANTTRLWSMFEFSIGYEIGIFKKKEVSIKKK
jgi:hypothetical protein